MVIFNKNILHLFIIRLSLTIQHPSRDKVVKRSNAHWRFHFDQIFQKFRLGSEWKGNIQILGLIPEVVLKLRNIGIIGKLCAIRPFLLGPVSPRSETNLFAIWLLSSSVSGISAFRDRF